VHSGTVLEKAFLDGHKQNTVQITRKIKWAENENYKHHEDKTLKIYIKEEIATIPLPSDHGPFGQLDLI